MPREFTRNVRIAEAIQRIAAPLLMMIAREKRLGMVTITDVAVASDLSVATIFVSVLGAANEADAITALKLRVPEIRTAVAQDLRLKKVPSLKLAHDGSSARSVRIGELLRAPKPPV